MLSFRSARVARIISGSSRISFLGHALFSRAASSFTASASFLDPSWGLSENARSLHEVATSFAASAVEPHALSWDQSSTFPVDALRAAAQLGFGSLWASEASGGSALSRSDALPVLEALAYACPSFAAYLSIHGMVARMIDLYGQPALKARLGPLLATAEKFASYCLTEPGAGSDAASISTKAVKEGDEWVISGQKMYISGGGASSVYVVMARTGGAESPGAAGISAFVVESGAPGLSFGANEAKMGWRNQPTASVFFDNVRVKESALLGTVGGGFKMAMQALDGGRLSIAACSVGAAASALDKAREYAVIRKTFGVPLAQHQAVSFKIADAAMDLFVARQTIRRAAAALDAEEPGARALCALAKAVATEKAIAIVDASLQAHGGLGYLASTGIEKLARDLRVHTILEGTSEMMRVILAREVLKR